MGEMEQFFLTEEFQLISIEGMRKQKITIRLTPQSGYFRRDPGDVKIVGAILRRNRIFA